MLWFVSYSMTSALHVDSIIMMEELHLFHEGKYGLGYLWAPYWGNRTLVPRLLMMLDERFFHFSNNPLVVVSLVAQMLPTTVLIWTEWRVIRNEPRWLKVILTVATVHLAFSSLQLETFLFGMDVLFTVGFLGAFASVVLFAMSTRDGKTLPWMSIAAFACALVCALSMGTGVFAGPVVVLVAIGLRARLRVIAVLVMVSAVYSTAYSVGYSNPGNSMGLAGALHHPLDAIRITALVLGGPITNQSLQWGAACGFAGLLLLIPATVRLLQGRASREESALTGISIFLALHASGMAMARFTPQFVAGLGTVKMLGSHDFTAPFFFWGATLALVLSRRGSLSLKSLALLPVAIVGYLTIHTVPSQFDMSMVWLKYHRTLDIAGAGMIMGATDPKVLFALYPDQRALDYYRPYMQQNRLSFFADDRASWIGRDLESVFGHPVTNCKGAIDTRAPAGHAILRLEGFVEGPGAKFPLKREIVLTDAKGKINGLGNTLITYEKRGGLDFVAYADGAAVAAYVITPDSKACRFGE